MLKTPSVSTSTAHWERATVLPAGGTGSAHLTLSGIVGGGASAFTEFLLPNDPGQAPPYLKMDAIRNKEFYRQFCKNLEMPAYIGLSENLTFKDLDYVVKRIGETLEYTNSPELILLTCGTDAMEQVARYIEKHLGDLIKSKGAKVILTGANRSFRREDTDIWENLEFAFESGFKKDIIPGVYVAFHKRLIPASLVVKEPFNGIEMNYVSKQSLKYWQDIGLRRAKDFITTLRLKNKLGKVKSLDKKVIEYPVNVIRENHNEFRDLVRRQHINAVLFVLYHSSTANTLDDRPAMSVAKLGEDLMEEGIQPFAVNENGEPVNLTATAYETSYKLGKAGVIGLGSMTRNTALAKLRLCASSHRDEMIERMHTNYIGEIKIN